MVADVDQRIYGWRGASQDRVRQIKEHFGMNILNLPENYRCPSSVLKLANKLIANNPHHDVVESLPSKPEEYDKSIRVMEFDTIEDEAAWIANDIAMRPVKLRQNCVILARTRSALKYVIAALEKHGIHGHLPSRKDKFVNVRMAWLYTVMRLANTSQDDVLLRQICKLFHTLEDVDLIPDRIIFDATINDGNYLRAWYRAAIQKELNPITTSFLKSAMPKLIDRLDVKNFVDECFEWFEKRQNEESAPDYDTEYMDEMRIWNRIISNVNADNEYMTLSVLLQQIELYTKESPAPKDSIPCYTISELKGMTFDHVYLIRFTEGDLPDWRAVKKGDDSHEIYEERRICFVAITRVQKSLTLTCPQNVSGFTKEQSRFLAEMGAVAYTQEDSRLIS